MTGKTIQGYLWEDGNGISLYPSEETLQSGNPYEKGIVWLHHSVEEFRGKKVSITIAVLEDE